MTEIKIKPDCRKALSKLYDYIDGEITAADRQKVRAHLEICRPCLTYFEFERLFHEYVCTKAPKPKAREEFKAGLLARIKAESRDLPTSSGGSVRVMPRYALAASVALLITVGAWFLANQGTSVSADWRILADYHYHRADVAADGIHTEDPREAYEFVAARLGEQTGELVPRSLPDGMIYHEACVMPLKSDLVAFLEWRDRDDSVSLVIARSSCLSICSQPEMKWHGQTYYVVTADGLNAVCWEEHGGYVCAILAPTDFGRMFAWAEQVRSPGGF